MEFNAAENANVAVGGGAGVGSAKTVIDAGAQAVLTGNCGPNAHLTLTAAGVKLYTGLQGTVAQVLEQFKTGKFASASAPNVQSHFGMGPKQQD